MNKIVVFRTHIELRDYQIGDCPFIERQFSIYNKTYHRLEPKGMHYNASQQTLYIPRCSDIVALERYFNQDAYVDQSVDNIRKTGPIGLKYTPRDETQIEAIKFLLSMDKYNANRNRTMLSLNLNTGKGKSYCSIASIGYMGIASMIITDTVGCLDQWENYIIEYTDIKREEIYRISGSPSIAKLFNRDINQYKIFLAPHATLKSYGDNQGWENISALFKYLGIGLKLYDEAHLDFDNMAMIDSYTNTNLTVYLTATMARSNLEEDQIFQKYFRTVPSIDLFDEEEDPHTEYVGIKYNSNPNPMDISRCKNNYGMDRNKYTNYVVHQQEFQNMLHILLDKALSKPGKCLWYIGTNEAIVYVRDWIYNNYPELIGNVGIYTSIVPKEVRHLQLDRKIILSTTKSAGAAMDIQGLAEVANIAEPFKSKVLAQQTLGRTRASDTIYKDLVDIGFPQTRAFYNYKKPTFSKYATECREITLRHSQLAEAAEKLLDMRSTMTCPIIFEDDR